MEAEELNTTRQDAIQGLINLGLSLGEAKTFVALMQVGVAEATPLAEEAAVPQPKIYGYLRSLEERGLVVKTEITGKPNQFLASPDHPRILQEIQRRLQTQFERTTQALDTLDNLAQSSVEHHYVTIIQGKRAVDQGIQDELDKIENNVTIFDTGHYQDALLKFETRRPEIKIKRPVVEVRKAKNLFPLFFKQFIEAPVFTLLQNNQPLAMFTDVDYAQNIQDSTCKSTIIVGQPIGDEEPVLIKITHPVVINFQIRLVQIVLQMIEQFKKMKGRYD